ncbi:MAG TPA: hypothetical protein VIK97_02770, partial [Casimicrobiaceae bacterium]
MPLIPRGLYVLAMATLVALPLRAESASCAVPKVLDDGWTIAAPEDAGFDVLALCAILDGVA